MNNAAAPVGLPGRGAGDAQFQNMMGNYMFYFAMENGGACPGYMTEKVWLALSRGSVPIYFGTDDIYDILPSPDAIIDLKKFKSPQELVRPGRYSCPRHPTHFDPSFLESYDIPRRGERYVPGPRRWRLGCTPFPRIPRPTGRCTSGGARTR